MQRYLDASRLMLCAAKGEDVKFKSVHDHQAALDSLNREIRNFTSTVFQPGLSPQQADLVASLIEEEDFCASLGETLYQIARRAERHPFGSEALNKVEVIVELVERAVAERLDHPAPHGNSAAAMQPIQAMRQNIVTSTSLPAEDRGALLALLGSAERAFFLAERIQSERASVSREVAAPAPAERPLSSGMLAPQGT